jgi:O-antigen/teichoic acid export membrane protein
MLDKIVGFFKAGHPRSVKAKKNILGSCVLKGASILVNLAYVPLLITTLGKEEYGIWLVLSSFISWLNFFDIGIANGLRNKLGAALAIKDSALAKTYISTTYAIISIIFIPVSLLALGFSNFLNWQAIFNTTSVSSSILNPLAAITLSFFALRFIVQIIGVVLLADQKPAFSSLVNLIISLAGLVTILVLKQLSIATLFVTGIILSITPILVFIGFTIYLFNFTYKEIKPSFSFIKFGYAKELFGLGFHFFIIQISGLVIFSSTNFIITQFFSPVEVTSYNIAYKYFSLITMTFGILLTPFWSAVTDAYTTNDFAWIKKSMKKYRDIAILLSVSSVIMLIFSNYAYLLWVGKSVNIPFTLSMAICLQTIVYTFWSPYVTFLNGTGKIKLVSYLVLIQCAFYIGLVFFLVKVFHLGVFAIVIASILSEIPIRIVQPIQSMKIINKKAYGIWDK